MSKPIKQSEAGSLSSKLRDGAVKLVEDALFQSLMERQTLGSSCLSQS